VINVETLSGVLTKMTKQWGTSPMRNSDSDVFSSVE